MESEAAERIATEIYDAIHNNVATKADILAVRGDIVLLRTEIKADVAAVRGEMHERESRIGIRLGALSSSSPARYSARCTPGRRIAERLTAHSRPRTGAARDPGRRRPRAVLGHLWAFMSHVKFSNPDAATF